MLFLTDVIAGRLIALTHELIADSTLSGVVKGFVDVPSVEWVAMLLALVAREQEDIGCLCRGLHATSTTAAELRM
ncbi:MAG: hypothetical protein ABIQ01_02275 [Pseudolysinimonas sp.]